MFSNIQLFIIKKTCRLRLICDGTRAETRFRLSTKRTSPFKSAGASDQSTTGRRAVHISLQGLSCSCKPLFCSHVTLTGYPLHSLVPPSLLLPCVTLCHHISNAAYMQFYGLSFMYLHVCKQSGRWQDVLDGLNDKRGEE
jgi:hypothetical protein